MDNRLTIVTPTFEKHYLQFAKMVKSISEKCLDKHKLEIIAVLEHKNIELFSKIVDDNPTLSLRLITTEDILQKLNISDTPDGFLRRVGKFTFQSMKKFGGILYANTNWSLVLDSETVFFNEFSAEKILNDYKTQKYVFFTNTKPRGEKWKTSLGYKINENTAEALKIDPITHWYMEIFHWFYEKEKVEDLIFNKLGNPWLNEINETQKQIDYSECILYYAYLREYHEKEYCFINLSNALDEYVENVIAKRFILSDLPFSLHGNDFLLSIVGANEVHYLKDFFEHYKIPFIRLEPAYITPGYISELEKLPNICATVSSQYLMWMDKKIAICLSGKFTHDEFRGYEQQVRHLLGFVAGVDCDIYIHGWKQACEPFIIDTINPKKYLFESSPNFKYLADKINFEESSFRKPGRDEGTLSMFYSMEKCFSLIDDIEQYDYIIRMRPDIYSEYSLKEILFSISDNGNYLNNVIYVPSNFQAKGMNDQFAIGRTLLMKKYFSMYSYIEKNIERLFFNPESMLIRYLLDQKIGVALLDMPYALHRGVSVRPWRTAQIISEQENVWWSKTVHIAKLQDLSYHYKERYISGKLLNSLPRNIRLLGKVANEEGFILIESYDYDPYVSARAVKKIFGINIPCKIKSLKSITSYEHNNYSSYYCIEINKSNDLIIHQTISDGKTVKNADIVCSSYTLLRENALELVPVTIAVKGISLIRKLFRFFRGKAIKAKLKIMRKFS